MKRRAALASVAALLGDRAAADPRPAEMARIDTLIAAVAAHTEIRFVRNGNEYDSAEAADFLRGKLKWRLGLVRTVSDFIDQVGTRSTTSGDAYSVRLSSGRTLPSAEFLRLELARIERR